MTGTAGPHRTDVEGVLRRGAVRPRVRSRRGRPGPERDLSEGLGAKGRVVPGHRSGSFPAVVTVVAVLVVPVVWAKSSASRAKCSSTRVGTYGCQRSAIPASSGVRSPLRALHGSQAATALAHDVAPPRDRGRTWSIVVAVNLPQY